jgi:hypothetical protein
MNKMRQRLTCKPQVAPLFEIVLRRIAPGDYNTLPVLSQLGECGPPASG